MAGIFLQSLQNIVAEMIARMETEAEAEHSIDVLEEDALEEWLSWVDCFWLFPVIFCYD